MNNKDRVGVNSARVPTVVAGERSPVTVPPFVHFGTVLELATCPIQALPFLDALVT